MMQPDEVDRWLNAERKVLERVWLETMGQTPPKRLSRPLMAKILIAELQWEASPECRLKVLRKFDRAVHTATWKSPRAASGTRLVREWNGQEHIVDVTEDGYLWNDQTWTSLTAIATAITGTKWSGPRFFGVRT